jgi:tetratricopeptide (TPR) repeat protein
MGIWAHARAWLAYQRGMMLRFWGHRMVRRRYYEGAARAFSDAVLHRPDYVDAYLARGLIYWRELQDGPAAVADFSRVLTLSPTFSEALFYRGMAYQITANYAAAVEDLRDAIARAPNAIWAENAYRQMVMLESILEDLPAQINGQDLLASGDSLS